jgi:subtilase family serine protease
MNISIASVRAQAASVLACAALFTATALAQKPVARILTPVDNLSRTTLTGSRPARVAAMTDAGRMPGDTPIQTVSLYFSRSAEQQAALDALIVAQQDPSSPLYHQWLEPDQFAAEFGAADSDLAQVQTWLQSQGFTNVSVSRNRSVVTFSGTTGQIETAFGTEMHYFKNGTETHFAPAGDLSIPAAFASAVQAVGNVSDFRPRSHIVRPTAKFTSSQTGNHFVTPGDVAVIYDINAAYSAGYTGAGQTITVIGQSAILTSDVTAFQTAAGTPVRAPNLILMPGTGTSTVYTGDESESDLDVEYSGAIAKGAIIDFVYTGSSPNYGAFDALGYAVTNKLGSIITTSYGDCETSLGQYYYNVYNAYAQQASTQGQTIISAAGDEGSTDCYEDTNLTLAQREAVAVDWPGSSAYVTSMGGSEYLSADVASTNTQYWTAASGSDVLTSAKSYIPEQVWNDDSATSGLSSGGGGVSVFTPAPTWQTGTIGGVAIPTNTYRMVPDISLASSPNNAGYLYCSSDYTGTGITGSCSNGFRDVNNSNLTVAGGTSFAAPIFAGMMALINQSRGAQGLVNPTLYKLAANATTYSTAFHDITSGSNDCLAGSTYCISPATTEYAATTGYDEASGLGSIDFYNLMTAWPGTVVAAPTATFSLSAPAVAITDGSSGTVTITVTPNKGYTGTVNLVISTNPLITNGCYTLGSATVTGTTAVTATATIYTSSLTCPTGATSLYQTGGKQAAAKAPARPGQPDPNRVPAEIALAGLLMAGFAGRRSARVRGLVMLALLAVAGFGLTGCGSSAGGTGVTNTVPSTSVAKGSYTVSVTGTDSTTGLTATTSFVLTVQ